MQNDTIRDMSTSNPHTHTLTQVFLPLCAQNFVECTNLPRVLYRSGTITYIQARLCTIPLHCPMYNENRHTLHTHTDAQQRFHTNKRLANKQIINWQRTAPAEGYNKKLSPNLCLFTLSFQLSLSQACSLFAASAARRLTTDWLS